MSQTNSDISDNESVTTSNETKTKEIVTQVRPNDVLFGRGRPFQMHPGNKRMHEMADQYKVRYAKMRSVDKRKVTLAIVKCVQNDFDGRFLKPTSSGSPSVPGCPPLKTCWVEVTDLEAQHKVRNAIRSRLREETPVKVELGEDFKIDVKASLPPVSPKSTVSIENHRIASGASCRTSPVASGSGVFKAAKRNHLAKKFSMMPSEPAPMMAPFQMMNESPSFLSDPNTLPMLPRFPMRPLRSVPTLPNLRNDMFRKQPQMISYEELAMRTRLAELQAERATAVMIARQQNHRMMRALMR